jgi:fused signal recognition particle receptor
LLEATLLERERQEAEAVKVARQALEAAEAPQRPRAQRALADLLVTNDEGRTEAVALYRELLPAAPPEEAPAVRVRLGKALLAAGRAAEAAEALAPFSVGQAVPGQSAAQLGLLLAEVPFAAGEHLEGLAVLAELKQRVPEAEEAIEERARRFRRDLGTGDLAGIVSKALREQLEARLSELAGEAALLERMRVRLARSREALAGRMESILAGRTEIDEDVLEQVEELLITADVGVQTTMAIMEKLGKEVRGGRLRRPDELQGALRAMMLDILRQSSGRVELQGAGPSVILMVGVNGAGKTTTIAKLAHRFREEGKSVLLVAGDTFRAGAIEQLQIWADRVGVPLIRQQEGSDPSAVAFDGMAAAKSRKADVVIIDTAGRLQTKSNLMDELRKIVRIIQKQQEGAPHETLLVLDGTAGQNALSQAKLFGEAADLTGIVLTKLDGTAKGGIVLSIANERRLPIKLIGIGERMTDLRDFDPDLFVEALFGRKVEPGVSKRETRGD